MGLPPRRGTASGLRSAGDTLMARPMTYPMGDLAVGESVSMPADQPGDAKRIARNCSQYGIRKGRAYRVRTIEGVAFITRLA
jgi:hypothetical protein